jgi:molybdopterin synthase sulfur carrier subunit
MSVELELRLRYFASIREALGRGEEALHPGGHAGRAARRADRARRRLRRGAGPPRPVRLALNQDLREESAALTPGAEVAFFRP